MHHPSLNNILLAVAWAVAGVGIVFLAKYAYKIAKSQTLFERRARRAVIWYWALLCLWQSCMALDLGISREPWLHTATPILVVVPFCVTMLLLVAKQRASREH